MVFWLLKTILSCSPLTYDNFVHAVAGSLASALALSIFYPWETTRTRLQVDSRIQNRFSILVIRDVYHQEGISGVYQGWHSLIVSSVFANFIYFYVFHGLKAFLCKEGWPQSVYADFVFGIIAGVAATISNPLWVVNTRLKLQYMHRYNKTEKKSNPLQTPNSIIGCLLHILKYEGFGALWSGTRSSLLLVSNPAIQYMVYEFLKRHLVIILDEAFVGDTFSLICGALAKVAATIPTYPFQVIQTRSRAGVCHDPEVKSVKGIIKLHGIFGLFRGLEAKLSQTVMTTALMSLIYERILLATSQIFTWYYYSVEI